MEYTNIYTPVILIGVCLVLGAVMGTLYMYFKNKDTILDLEMELDDLRDALEQKLTARTETEYVYSKGEKHVKAELEVKDDMLDRLSGLHNQSKIELENAKTTLNDSAAKILVLEGRLKTNKTVAIKREKELKAALIKINTQLDTIEELQTVEAPEPKNMNTDDEIKSLQVSLNRKDNIISRNTKRIQELESELEEYKPSEGETGYYKRMKKIQ